MYRLFDAPQAMEFSVGCHARCSNFVVKSKVFPFASTAELSAPFPKKQDERWIAEKYVKQSSSIAIGCNRAKLSSSSTQNSAQA